MNSVMLINSRRVINAFQTKITNNALMIHHQFAAGLMGKRQPTSIPAITMATAQDDCVKKAHQRRVIH